MDIHYELNGLSFVWDDRKAASTPRKHDGGTFGEGATVFFDPFFRLVDASSDLRPEMRPLAPVRRDTYCS
ncbi:hypothetical protein JKG47_20670 [Acidithiobacillus sp. MC6.1]|nr:hypothetical protein [Acidithiobacillus sp. MC6.1]